METQGLRRSGRARQPIKSYADEQAEADDLADLAPPTKRKKKSANVDNGDADFGDTYADPGLPEVKAAKVVKKRVSSAATALVQGPLDFKIAKVVKRRGNFGGAYEGMPDPNAAKAVKKRVKEAATVDPNGEVLNTSQSGKKRNKSVPRPLPEWHADAAQSRIAREKRKIRTLEAGDEEKRLHSYVDEPNETFTKALKAASAKRMYVIDRERTAEQDCHAHHIDCPLETIKLAGSTGNVYTITISHVPTCDCPVGLFQRKDQRSCCKHILYILHTVLKAPNDLLLQNAFLSSELREIFAGSPTLSSENADEEDKPTDGHRKSLEGDCPICFTEFEENENVTWCRAACGNNIHQACFNQWERTKPGNITCPFCRTPWQAGDTVKTKKVEVANIAVPQDRQAGGYKNVRHLLSYDE